MEQILIKEDTNNIFYILKKDLTLYEVVTQSRNTGLDEILEVRKDMNDGSVVNVSRTLIKFDLSDISSSIVKELFLKIKILFKFIW